LMRPLRNWRRSLTKALAAERRLIAENQFPSALRDGVHRIAQQARGNVVGLCPQKDARWRIPKVAELLVVFENFWRIGEKRDIPKIRGHMSEDAHLPDGVEING